MNNAENRPAFLFPESQVLTDIFRTPEVIRRANTLPAMSRVEGAAIIFSISQDFINNWGDKMKNWSGEYFRTEPVKALVNGEPVELIIHSGKDRKDVSILVRLHEQDTNLPILLDVNLKPHDVSAENGNSEKASLEEIRLTLGLLSTIGESLSKIPQKFTGQKS